MLNFNDFLLNGYIILNIDGTMLNNFDNIWAVIFHNESKIIYALTNPEELNNYSQAIKIRS